MGIIVPQQPVLVSLLWVVLLMMLNGLLSDFNSGLLVCFGHPGRIVGKQTTPILFPISYLLYTPIIVGSNGTYTSDIGINNWSKTGFNLDTNTGNNDTGWIAIGY